MAAIEPASGPSFGTFSLSGKVAVVTGGASGIGRAISDLFAARGARVCILDVNLEAAKAAADEINKTSPENECSAYACNVAKGEEVEGVFREIAGAFGRVDVLVNNAGVGAVDTAADFEEANFRRLFDINVLGVANCLKSCINIMAADDKGGSIINIASIASVVALKDRFSYSMSKGAVLALSRSVAMDYVEKGIRSNAVCPSRVHTNLVDTFLAKSYPGREAEKFKELAAYQPMRRMGEPREIAALCLYLAADESRWVTGVDYSIDGGVRMMPGMPPM